MRKASICLPFILIFICSCAPEVTIFYPSDFVKENTVIINNEIDLKDLITEENYSSFVTSAGNVSLSINGEVKKITTQKGGLLNLNKEDFVIFPIYYGNSTFPAWDGAPRPIMIDSVLYYSNFLEKSSDSTLLAMVDKYTDFPYNPKKSKDLELSKVLKEDFFVEKIWDFDISQDIPEQIEVQVKQNSISIGGDNNIRSSKRIIRKANFFKVYTLLSEDFNSRDLRDSTSRMIE